MELLIDRGKPVLSAWRPDPKIGAGRAPWEQCTGQHTVQSSEILSAAACRESWRQTAAEACHKSEVAAESIL